MGKDDYFRLAVLGKTPEERKIGRVVTTLLKMQAHTNGDLKTFEVFVGAFPQETLFELAKKRASGLKEYNIAQKKWEEENPCKNGEEYRTWLQQRRSALKHLDWSSVFDKISPAKQEVFNDLSGRFRGMMTQLRSITLLEMLLTNYLTTKNIQSELLDLKDTDLEDAVNKFEAVYSKLDSQYSNEPASERVLDGLEKLNETFFSQISRRLDTHNVKPAFLYDIFTGKMGCSYFTGSEYFFKIFDSTRTSNSRHIYFYLNGLLEGEYKLFNSPSLEFKDLGKYCGRTPQKAVYDLSSVQLISPIQFRVQLPDKYAHVVQKVFDEISKDYAGRIIPASELREWHSRYKKLPSLSLVLV